MTIDTATRPIAPAALAELKQWLRISVSDEDALLLSQLRAGLDLAAAYTGQMLLIGDVYETLALGGEWVRLSARPVQVISQMLTADDTPLPMSSWSADIDRDGHGWVRRGDGMSGDRVRVGYRAGLAKDWTSLPDALRQGVIRYAAHAYAMREAGEGAPPASITALWRPWRRVQL